MLFKSLFILLLIVGCEETLEPEDCAGVIGGNAGLDSCAICMGGTTNLSACIKDCNGDWGGAAKIDSCAVCDIDDTNDCSQDCNGDWGGDLVNDECGVCGGSGITDGACDCDGNVQEENYDCDGNCLIDVDCFDVCGGSAYIDNCDICDSNSGNDCPLSDIDGNEYAYIKIGNQIWMQENLKVTHYRNGDEISTGYSDFEWGTEHEGNLSIGAYAVYNNDLSNAEIYGNLYNWFAIDDSRGICPDGWHVPTYDDWKLFANYIGGMWQENEGTDGRYIDATKIKECKVGSCPESDYWVSTPYTMDGGGAIVVTNESGFTALPAGNRQDDHGNFRVLGRNTYFWSFTAGIYDGTNGEEEVWAMKLYYDRDKL